MADVKVYANAATRTLKAIAPTVGDCAFLVDTGAVEFYYGAFYGWRPPWNLPWGQVARAELASDSGTFPVWPNYLSSGLTVTGFRPVIGRRYNVKVSAWVQGGTPTTQLNLQLLCSPSAAPTRTDGTTFSDVRELGEQLIQTINAGIGNDVLAFEAPFIPAHTHATGLYDLWVSGSVLSGAVGDMVTDEGTPCSLSIHDTGPAANPTYA